MYFLIKKKIFISQIQTNYNKKNFKQLLNKKNQIISLKNYYNKWKI